MTPISPDEWAARIPWHPKARIVAQLTRAANDLRDEIDALEARRAKLRGEVEARLVWAVAMAAQVGVPPDPRATRHWRELGMLCDGDECDGVAIRNGLCSPCSGRARRAS